MTSYHIIKYLNTLLYHIILWCSIKSYQMLSDQILSNSISNRWMHWPFDLLTCQRSPQFFHSSSFLATSRCRADTALGDTWHVHHSCFEQKNQALERWKRNTCKFKRSAKVSYAFTPGFASMQTSDRQKKRTRPVKQFLHLHSSTVSTWHHTAAQVSPTRCTTGPLLWVTTPVVTWKTAWHFDSSHWDARGAHQSCSKVGRLMPNPFVVSLQRQQLN